jgi:hypothetical protein
MKVWIVLPDYSYEGWGRPEGAFLTKAGAEGAVAEWNKIHSAPLEIFELDAE